MFVCPSPGGPSFCPPAGPSVRPPAGEEQNEPKTHLELMAEMRDYKRRRQSYRAKNVHITKKSYTEVFTQNPLLSELFEEAVIDRCLTGGCR